MVSFLELFCSFSSIFHYFCWGLGCFWPVLLIIITTGRESCTIYSYSNAISNLCGVPKAVRGEYGSIKRFYVKLMKDRLFFPEHQEFSIAHNPPEKGFKMHASDHSPFFSQPHQLCNHLIHIATLWRLEGRVLRVFTSFTHYLKICVLCIDLLVKSV